MPAIAQGAKAAGAEFYWELGDFRALYDFDQDMQGELRDGKPRKLTITDYLNQAWDDFIRNQANAFAMPVFLGIGNHELYGGKTRADTSRSSGTGSVTIGYGSSGWLTIRTTTG